MNLNELLSEKRQAILGKWFDAVLETYPQDTAVFLKRQKDRFANPVGSTIYNAMDSILGDLLSGSGNKIPKDLDDIIRIRAIQDFAPSHALSFMLHLKEIVREGIKNEINSAQLSDELTAFEQRVDNLLMLSFDLYMKCREKVYDLKANELRNMTYKLLERANKIFEAKYRDVDLQEIVSRGNKSERGE